MPNLQRSPGFTTVCVFAVGTMQNLGKSGLSAPKMIALAKVMESFLESVHKAGSPDPG